MNFGSMLALAVVGTMMAVGTAGCSAPTDDANSTNAEATDSTTEDLTGGSCAASLASGAVPGKHRALLDTIAFTEGTRGHGQDGYNVTFAYHYFSSCTHHPATQAPVRRVTKPITLAQRPKKPFRNSKSSMVWQVRA